MQLTFKIKDEHTTHTGGKGELLHDWYHYLEGFSSSFVKEIINTYQPNAKIVLEPFAGVGTTPLFCALNNIESYYCEVNPLLQKIINIKKNVLNLSQSQKYKLAIDLREITTSLDQKILKSNKSEILEDNYKKAFINSVFFKEDTFVLLLKLRTYIDALAKENIILSDLVELATVSNIVKCSLLKRSGDVRFKTQKELDKGIPNLIESIIYHLELFIRDIKTLPIVEKTPHFLNANAKNILSLNKIDADIVITSPPYLNGTNYFRNTKLELWFMGEIDDKNSLRKFRDEVVTSGINDVTTSKNKATMALVSDLYQTLQENSYDSRIPKMMNAYFLEMRQVFQGLGFHTKDSGIICIDIGDSIYSDIHIPTHKILAEIGQELGWVLIEEVLLRSRTSKNGNDLGQYLLVFRNKVSNE